MSGTGNKEKTISINEIRKGHGLSPIEGGDRPIVKGANILQKSRKISIEVDLDTKPIDEAIEKASLLTENLREAQKIINLLSKKEL